MKASFAAGDNRSSTNWQVSCRKAASGSESTRPPATTIELAAKWPRSFGFARPLPNSVVEGESK